jgi:cell wall assembly regulator SMI1
MGEYHAIRRFVGVDTEAWANVALTADVIVRYSAEYRWATPYSQNVDQTTIKVASQEAASTEFHKQCDDILTGGFREVCQPIESGTERDIEGTWVAIEKWLYRNTPPFLIWPLADGASPDSISAAELQMSCQLPEDVRFSYLRHDGSNKLGLFAFLGEGEWCSLADVVKHWKFFHKVKDDFDTELAQPALGPMKSMPWNDLWIPFTDYSTGNHLCIDLDPADGGNRGQIFSYRCDYYGAWRFIARAFP